MDDLPDNIPTHRWRSFVGMMVALGLTLLFPFLLVLSFMGGQPTATRVKHAPTVTVQIEVPLVEPRDDEIIVMRELSVTNAVPAGLPEPVRRAASQTVAIRATMRGTIYGYGTGIVLKPGYVLTAAHVVRPFGSTTNADLTIYCADRKVNGTVTAVDDARDTAIIAAECPGATLQIAKSPLKDGENVRVIGYTFTWADPSAERFGRSTIVHANNRMGKPVEDHSLYQRDILNRLLALEKLHGAPLVAIAGIFIPGNSGSPVCRPDGTIVGMVVMFNIGERQSYFVPAESLRLAITAGVK